MDWIIVSLNLFSYASFYKDEDWILFICSRKIVVTRQVWNIFSFDAENNRSEQKAIVSRSSKQSSNFSRITYPYGNTDTVYTRVYISVYPESFYFYSLQLLGAKAIRARSTNKSGSLSNDKCFRSAVVIRGIALLQSNSYNTLIHLCHGSSLHRLSRLRPRSGGEGVGEEGGWPQANASKQT